jgi:hypothetical protein
MKKTILLLALFSLIVVLTSCKKAEEITITKYFQAMQHNDKDTMSAMAVEPKAIKFKSFKVASVDEPMLKELELSAMEQKIKAIERQKKDQFNAALDKNDVVEELKDELAETRRRARRAELQKQLETAEGEANEERSKYIALNNRLLQMKKNIETEKSLIESSTGIDKNFELYTGETHIHKVTVSVTLANDEVKDYIFVLRRNLLKLEDRPINGRMIIIKIATPEEYEQELKEQEEAEGTESEEVTEPQPTGEQSEGQ